MKLFSATGVLKGYDALLNIVLDNTTEYLRGGLISDVGLVNYSPVVLNNGSGEPNMGTELLNQC